MHIHRSTSSITTVRTDNFDFDFFFWKTILVNLKFELHLFRKIEFITADKKGTKIKRKL